MHPPRQVTKSGPVTVELVGDDVRVSGPPDGVARELRRMSRKARAHELGYLLSAVLVVCAGLAFLRAGQPSMVSFLAPLLRASEAPVVGGVLAGGALVALIVGAAQRRGGWQPLRLDFAAKLVTFLPAVSGSHVSAWVALAARPTSLAEVVTVSAWAPHRTVVVARYAVRHSTHTTHSTRTESVSELPKIGGVPIRPARRITTTWTTHHIERRAEVTVRAVGGQNVPQVASLIAERGFEAQEAGAARLVVLKDDVKRRDDVGLRWTKLELCRRALTVVGRALGATA